MEIVTLTRYCEMSGESKGAVRTRVNRGIWQVGTHVLKLNGIKEWYIDLAAIAVWARDPKNWAD